MLEHETNIALTAGQTVVSIPFTFQVGTNELWVFLNGLLVYAEKHYQELNPSTLLLLWSPDGTETLTVGIVGTGGTLVHDEGLTPAPTSFGFSVHYPGTLTFGFPTSSPATPITHIRLYRRRGTTAEAVITVPVGTETVTLHDVQISDEYFYTYANPVNALEGEGSSLVRIHSHPDTAPALT